MDIAEFLEARWAERAAAAKAAGYGAAGDYLWQEVDPDRMPGLIGTACGDVVTFNQGTPAYAVSPSPGQAAHIALNDPEAVRADIEAKRRILFAYELALAEEAAGQPMPTARPGLELALTILANAYREHPDHPLNRQEETP